MTKLKYTNKKRVTFYNLTFLQLIKYFIDDLLPEKKEIKVKEPKCLHITLYKKGWEIIDPDTNESLGCLHLDVEHYQALQVGKCEYELYTLDGEPVERFISIKDRRVISDDQ